MALGGRRASRGDEPRGPSAQSAVVWGTHGGQGQTVAQQPEGEQWQQ
eukprot:COSAG06_NODE_44774_length_360_cov_1.421456_1_plen_46_part_10